MKTLFLVGMLIVVVAYAAFLTTSNDAQIEVDLLFTTVGGIPLWQGLLASFVLGALLVGVACLRSIVRQRLEIRRQNRLIARLEQEVHGLRTLPLEEKSHSASPPAHRV